MLKFILIFVAAGLNPYNPQQYAVIQTDPALSVQDCHARAEYLYWIHTGETIEITGDNGRYDIPGFGWKCLEL